ncbi:hypothetical protein L9F63_008876 [Diploptera punctata]|uniref:Large ribosomal subunit protein bL32m n=1 Tax=Diploptera punctata TaxID=6984 RepID=A0AAD7Z4Y7_DIPPU|nr:hypothetical protein L9F63_008876 [Diploptera punctata]
MAARLMQKAIRCLEIVDNALLSLFRNQFPPPALSLVSIDAGYLNHKPTNAKISIKDILGDGFLWAVPKSRRTVERRLNRKFGYPYYVWKMLVPKSNLLVCNTCGHHHEANFLCPNCYAKVRAETEAMQTEIQNELGLNPVEKEVVVLYEGEKEEKPLEFWEGKRIVEMKKERPAWFSKNLLEKSTVQPSSSEDVKPTELA